MHQQLDRRSFLAGLAAALTAANVPSQLAASIQPTAELLVKRQFDKDTWYSYCFTFDVDDEKPVRAYINAVEVDLGDMPIKISSDVKKGALEFFAKGDLISGIKLNSEQGNFQLLGERCGEKYKIARSLRLNTEDSIHA